MICICANVRARACGKFCVHVCVYVRVYVYAWHNTRTFINTTLSIWRPWPVNVRMHACMRASSPLSPPSFFAALLCANNSTRYPSFKHRYDEPLPSTGTMNHFTGSFMCLRGHAHWAKRKKGRKADTQQIEQDSYVAYPGQNRQLLLWIKHPWATLHSRKKCVGELGK